MNVNATLPVVPAEQAAREALADMEALYGERPVDPVLRALDLVISLTILAVCAPLMAMIALAIRVSSGGPTLYHGPRVGRGGQVFAMYKFRTLKRGAEQRLGNLYGRELSRRTELETTLVGRPLRATHLDELPQLINVARGEMSMVGPRPIRPTFFAELAAAVPQTWQRLVVRPGVTGFAQTRITREDSWSDKLAHDLEYIADRSVTLYFQVLAATTWRIMRRAARPGDTS